MIKSLGNPSFAVTARFRSLAQIQGEVGYEKWSRQSCQQRERHSPRLVVLLLLITTRYQKLKRRVCANGMMSIVALFR